jgi:SOS response regulatory protein OraA/RecX
MAKLKPCKTCGKEVAKSAKSCPSCGQKLKMGFFKKALIGFGVLIVLIIVANLGSGDDTETASSTANESSSEKGTKKDEPKKELSNEGISSDVTIKVGSVEDAQEVGNEFTKEKAQGIFKIVEISLTNNQKDAITVDANSFKLVDDQDREFTYSSGAQISYDIENGGKSDFFLTSLNPGLTLTGKIVFDVPADAKGFIMKARGGMMGKEIKLKVSE